MKVGILGVVLLSLALDRDGRCNVVAFRLSDDDRLAEAANASGERP